MSISSTNSSSGVGYGRFLVQNIQYSARMPVSVAGSVSSRTIDPTSDRIQQLVSQVKDYYLGASGAGGFTSDSGVQSSVDDALSEISQLLGSSLESLVGDINSRQLGVRASAVQGGLRLTSHSRNSSFTVESRPVRRTYQLGSTEVSGQNLSQITSVDASSYASRADTVISGVRSSLSTGAVLAYQGNGSGLTTGSATFDLTGRLGTANVSIIKGESLNDLASRINGAASATGVLAEAVGEQILLRSDTVLSSEPRSTNTISGSVVRNATTSELTYTGFLGAVTNNANFLVNPPSKVARSAGFC